MKTTIEISDVLLEEAKARAASEGTTLRAVVERGLRLALAVKRDAERPRRFDPPTARLGAGQAVDMDDWAAAKVAVRAPRHSDLAADVGRER